MILQVCGIIDAKHIGGFAASNMEGWEIKLTKVNDNGKIKETFIYIVDNPISEINP